MQLKSNQYNLSAQSVILIWHFDISEGLLLLDHDSFFCKADVGGIMKGI